ncbi:hypothetical protein BpHYR1_013006, partial [Brachionus plicatilis]
MNYGMARMCESDRNCGLLYTLVGKQVSLFSNASDFENINCLSTFCPNSKFNFNQSINLYDLCRCIALSFVCNINRDQEKNAIESDLVRIIYLILSLCLIVASVFVNLLTTFLLFSEYKNLILTFCNKAIFCCMKETILNGKDLKKIIKKKSSNSISDMFIVCLLFSNWIITIYVIPNQTYLFYINSNIFDCQFTEFLKAYSVSMSIYSVVAISLQHFLAIKFSHYSLNLTTHRLIDTLSFISIISFFRSLRYLAKTLFFSRAYRQHLIATILLICMWLASASVGFYNRSQYKVVFLGIGEFLFNKDKLPCSLPKELKIATKACTSKGGKNTDSWFQKQDMIYMIFLLVIPNIIVFLSYAWVCYHIWSKGSNKNMVSFRLFYQKNKILKKEEVKIEKIRCKLRKNDKKRVSLSDEPSNDDDLMSKNNLNTPKNQQNIDEIIRLNDDQK